ncbi:MAG: type II secretion system F family protein [Candidatus Omnitrophica bacterium]|nr:type II secretion system F family protein [Candidatus Omnitrophota bacterium]
MSFYRYTVKDKNGQAISGTLEANSLSEAAEILHRREFIILSLQEIKDKKRGKKQVHSGKVSLDDLVVFSRQLATLIEAGIPLVQALGILAEQIENRFFKQIIIKIKQDIESGVSFYDALARYPKIFSELFINMCRAGEASGMLNEVLERLANYLEKTANLIRKVRSSLIYPAVIVTMAILITTFLLIKVVPTFRGIFEMMGGALPIPTRILIAISDLFRRAFLFIFVSLVLLAFLLKRYIDTEKGKYLFDKQKLKVPVLGELFLKVAIAKFSRTFSTLVKSGVQILSALEIVGKTAGNKLIEKIVYESREAIKRGEPLSQPLARSGVFPPLVYRMISVGEQTGQLENMLSKIADFYEEQVDAAISGLTSLIEPLVIAFLGTVIGGIVIALFMPIFKISQLIGR